MSRLNELIQELCPDGVEFKKIHDVAEVGTGCCNGNEAEDGGVYPFFVRSQNVKAKNDFQYDEEAIIIPGEGGIGDIFHYVNGKYALHQRVYRIHFIDKTINAKFIYYYMKSNFKSFILKKAVSATVTSIRKPMIEKFEIPIPPLDVQNVIVRILDTFTSHAAELQAELQARKEQYEYYRNKCTHIRQDDENVKWMKLPEICENLDKKRKAVTASNRISGPYPYYGASGIVDYVNSYIFEGNYLLVSEDGANLLARSTPIAFSISGKNWVNNHAHVLKFHNIFTQKYIEHYINMIDVAQYISGGAQPKLNQESLNKMLLPVPSQSEQQRIVFILDKFEALVNDLTEGLPAEIAAVQEQYEYYRNKLLSFPKIKES